MRTKTTVLSAAVVAAGALSSVAQNVYSVNVVGYVNVVIPTGFSLIANPLDAGNNTVSNLFNTAVSTGSQPAQGNTVYSWNGANFVADANDPYGGSWGNPNLNLAPGVGFFVNNGNVKYTNTFVGTVLQGNLTNALHAGFNLVSSKVPQDGFIVDLGLNFTQGDTIYLWNGGNFVAVANDPYGGTWQNPIPGFTVSPTKGPLITNGSSFFYKGDGTATWVRNFTVQ